MQYAAFQKSDNCLLFQGGSIFITVYADPDTAFTKGLGSGTGSCINVSGSGSWESKCHMHDALYTVYSKKKQKYFKIVFNIL